MKKILITGAGGFIGSYLVQNSLAADQPFETWAAIRKTTSREFLQDPNIHFIELNYADKDVLRQEITDHVKAHGRWDYVIHNMGLTKALDVNDFEKVNYRYTRNLIEALQEAGAIPDKFVYMSSLSAAVSEKDQTCYGRSKIMAEDFLRQQTAFPYLIFRPTGVYGPREKDYLVLLKTIDKGLNVSAGMKIQRLSFIHVIDLVDIIYTAMLSPIQNKTYAVSDGSIYTDREYTRMIKTFLGKKFVLQLRIPLPIVKLACCVSEDIAKMQKKTSTLNRDKYRILRRRDWSCDITPLKEDLGFEPKHTLEWGLRDSIQWYRENGWL